MSLANPYWLLALLLLPIIAIGAGMVAKQRAELWGKLVAQRLRKHLIRSGSAIPRWLSFIFLMGATTFIIVAMSRPRGDGGVVNETTVGRNLLITLDLSRSMRVQDVQPDRLSLAKLVIYELLEAMPGDRIGLVGFAGEPYLYAPLTIDHSAVRETVEQMDETWPTMGGSDLGAATRLSIETLKKTGQSNNAMVIISDGEKHKGDIEQMIAEAREAGVYIITIGVGTEDGAYIPNADFPGNITLDENGNPILSRLYPDNLTTLARETDGSFAMAGSGADIPLMVKTAISGLNTFELEGSERKVFIEFYQWLVLPAILLLTVSLIAGTRWRALAPVTSLALLMLSAPTSEAEEPAPSPEQLEMERLSDLASKERFEGRRAKYRLGEAVSAYRLQQWNRASHAYSQALRTHNDAVRMAAHHGLGNTLFQKGWLNFFDAPYTAELESMPSLKRFENEARLKIETLKRSQPSGDESSEDGYEAIERTILDWSDSVRHFQSVLDLEPEHQGAIQNRELSIAYLKKLQELLIEDEQRTEESMPEPEPEPSEGDANGSENESPGDQDPNQQGEQGNDPQPSPDGDPNDNGNPNGDTDPNADPNQQSGERDPNAEQGESDPNSEMRPGESPEQHARRRLRESADSEKGPMSSGRIKLQQPKKDW